MRPEDYLHILNKTIDPSLAATLAGLAFAIAALLYSISSSIDGKITIVKTLNGTPTPHDTTVRNAMRKACKHAINASYCFIAFLFAETLSGPIPTGVAPPRTITFLDSFSVLTAAGAGGAGLVLIFRSARIVKRAL